MFITYKNVNCSYFQFVVKFLGYTEILIQSSLIKNDCFVKYVTAVLNIFSLHVIF